MQAAIGTPSQLAAAPRGLTAGRRAAPLPRSRVAAADPGDLADNAEFEDKRISVNEAAKQTILTPRFYTTDFEAMDDMFSLEKNPGLPMEELTAVLQELRRDYNKRSFVRSELYASAAAALTGDTRRVMIDFLERACTTEFSGFLMYKELGRKLQGSNPVLAEIFSLLARDEARHAGFAHKGLTDFNMTLDLGCLTSERTYTFFKPKFILYATYLSEVIGYWRYITIYRNLQRTPDRQTHPLFEMFESWCQDEARHGDFLAAALKARPELLRGMRARLWGRFFCLAVYCTMYLNDHSSQFRHLYEALGLEVTPFCRHVITQHNRSVQRLFPEVPDVEQPAFWAALDRLAALNSAAQAIDATSAPTWLKRLRTLPLLERAAAECVRLYLAPTKRCGSLDVEGAGAYRY
ncbi:copper target 1 [Micractinium conductrix]|uniref:magnesium-protoporphyrin IX monomethyl ester (oxidative) cyclase n=1 Tax=Micractinium conductrix TaxID=554055 RepID=A0A2P6VSA3_9CHLO|nr:copper target 1 [Micractinium conductrix]|eukprot:PSC76971.1 copper target 1 [Micractinium conductrix]